MRYKPGGRSPMLLVALVGFLIGFLGSVPIAGPIAALVLRRGLEGRPRSAFAIAAGASVAEGIYAFLAFWGIGELIAELPIIETISRVAGAVLLILLGALFWVRPPQASTAASEVEMPVGIKRNAALGFTITGLNPTLIATWSAAVTMGYSLLPAGASAAHAVPFSLGATFGIASWFSILLWLIRRFRERFRPATLDRVVRGTGTLLVLLGGWAAIRFGAALLE